MTICYLEISILSGQCSDIIYVTGQRTLYEQGKLLLHYVLISFTVYCLQSLRLVAHIWL